jgi:hypothetical protein
MARVALWQVPLGADAPWMHREGVLWLQWIALAV